MKKLAILLIPMFCINCFAAEPEFYVFSKDEAKVAFCKTKPPKLFALKIVADDKVQANEVTANIEKYEEGFAEFMDLDTMHMIESGEKPPKECFVFKTENLQFPVLVKNVTEKTVFKYFKSMQGLIAPNTKKEIKIATDTYTIDFPAFDKPNADGTTAGMKNKDIVLKAGKWKCQMASVPYLDDKPALQIIIGADFNGDSLPDLIMESAAKGTRYSLVLSDLKKNGCRNQLTHQHPPGE